MVCPGSLDPLEGGSDIPYADMEVEMLPVADEIDVRLGIVDELQVDRPIPAG